MENKLEQMVREIMQPVYDVLVSNVCMIFSNVQKNLPATMSDAEKEQILTDILNKHKDVLVGTIKASVPTNLDEQLKEANNGRK